MGKMKIVIYCYVTADILTDDLQKCSLIISPLPNISFLSKCLTLNGCHGNQKAKFCEKILKNHLLRSPKGDSEMFITLASTKLAFFCCRCSCVFIAMAAPFTYNGKSENWHLLLSHCKYFDKSLTEKFLV